MNPKCASCEKTVYPMEKLNCLDKYWHKGCFKCTACDLKLTMKNYKGYDKMPYCNTHYPTTKFTAVAETPEYARIAQNSKIQSNVKYHEDFEKQRGTKTSVATDPELQRIRQNTAIQSQVAYKGILSQRSEMEKRRPSGEQSSEEVVRRPNPGKISDYDPSEATNYYEGDRSSANVVYDSQRGEANQGQQMHGHRTQPGSIADYDPINDQHSSIVRNSGSAVQVPPTYNPEPPRPSSSQLKQTKPTYIAMYDYVAADDDEVGFNEGDQIIDVTIIDDGWMEGRVQRTGEYGMLPSNYVELAK